LSAVRFRDVNAPDGLRMVRSPLQPASEVREVALEGFTVVLPCFAIDTRARISLEGKVCSSKMVDVVNVVKERSKPLFLILPCSSTYSLESAVRIDPALSPEPVALMRVPLGQAQWLVAGGTPSVRGRARGSLFGGSPGILFRRVFATGARNERFRSLAGPLHTRAQPLLILDN
jgi:hypothetical protein